MTEAEVMRCFAGHVKGVVAILRSLPTHDARVIVAAVAMDEAIEGQPKPRKTVAHGNVIQFPRQVTP